MYKRAEAGRGHGTKTGPATPPGDHARPRAGRPPVLDEAHRRARLLDAAAKVFLEVGYSTATMNAIALQAGMSKKTVYQLFPSKIALFDALLKDRIFADPAPVDLTGCDQEESLTRLLFAIGGVLLLPDRVGLIRLIVADGRTSPELNTAFERLHMTPEVNIIETWLRQEQQSGALRRGDVREDANLLFGMTVAFPILQALVGAPRAEFPPEQQIRIAIRVFLQGLALA